LAQACQSNRRSGTRAATEMRAANRLEVAELKAPACTTHRLVAAAVVHRAASSVLAVWVGAIVATIIGFGTAWIVITLTDMLKQ
jgi:O-glycosyl hydrolase